mmetsp:Transcript_11889/g.15429  ORF Transcript_11889/g.15429 Transcript_11889/m.15429 type:complete len:501 (-) Transcript_11889:1623-3125(-)|eukprot:CAMPEP_0184013658 /NCGR_PEP_ID=MMETSP0954-20121128/5148_1 /TAXON_ID=627963 /ORGANISM="Aplanochytrium sp, Strain PBS07" /LENGTH=500 /DNA_ID=CAMNT_0026293897 /DNA_START=85 /DNA_END=1587 /DNA_ORIENTATION=-
MGRKIRAALIDLSGTLFVEEKLVEKSVEAIKALKDAGIKVKYVSNTTTLSRIQLVQKLKWLGFPAQCSDVITSLSSASAYVSKKKLNPLLFLTNEAKTEFRDSGSKEKDSLVIGLSERDFNCDRLSEAMNLLLETKGELIALHKNKYHARSDGLHIGPGAFVTALEYACDISATVIGKPSAKFFKTAIESIDISPPLDFEDCVMIGDDVISDVNGAVKHGMFGLLVKTGKYRPEDRNKVCDYGQTCVLPNIYEAARFVLAHNRILEPSDAKKIFLEVEKKFEVGSSELETLEKRLLEVGAQFESEESFEDVYFDTSSITLMSKDIWLRQRRGEWELKFLPAKSGVNNNLNSSVYQELSEKQSIVSFLANMQSSTVALEDVKPVIKIESLRKKYTFFYGRRKFSFDIDFAKLTSGSETSLYSVGELEAIAGHENEVPICQMQIEEILDTVGIQSTKSKVPGKVIVALWRHNRRVFDSLLSSGVCSKAQAATLASIDDELTN